MENRVVSTSTSTAAGAYYMPVVTTGGNGSSSITYGSGGGGGISARVPGPPAPRTPLEWLDSEVEKTCALARGAG